MNEHDPPYDDCMRHRPALLTADPDVLRGVGDSELARHIRGCARCTFDAQRILATTAMFAARMDSGARTPKTRRAVAESDVLPVWWALPIAAVLASVLIGGQRWRERNDDPVPRIGAMQPLELPAEQPIVNAPADRNVAVFRTTENITVVWNLGAKGGS